MVFRGALNTINAAIGDISQKDFKTVRFYKDPTLKDLCKYTCNIYNYFYVYKVYPEFPKAGTAVLLGTKPRFEPSDTSSLKGWVDINDIIIWNLRLCVYPNTNYDAVRERKERKLKSSVLESLKSAKKVQKGQHLNKKDTIIWNTDLYVVRDSMNPYAMRLPVVEKLKDGMVKLCAFKIQNLQTNESGLNDYLNKSAITGKDIKVLTTENSGYWLEGYSPMATKLLSYPIWGFELLYTQKDLGELINSMDKLQYVDDDTELRENFDKVWHSVLKSHLINATNSQDIEEMSFGEIEDLVFGGLGTSSILDKKLKDLKDRDQISTQTLQNWAKDIDKKRILLVKISSQMTPDMAKYTFESNEERYYWIPVDLLP